MKYVLFVCNPNAGRSQKAQALFQSYAPADVRGESAGSHPAAHVWPEMVEVMREVGIDISRNKPKRLSVELATTKIDAIRHDPTTHRWRLAKLLPGLIEEFGDTRPAEVIRGCADRVLDDYDDVPIRSHILTFAHKRTRELREEHCALL